MMLLLGVLICASTPLPLPASPNASYLFYKPSDKGKGKKGKSGYRRDSMEEQQLGIAELLTSRDTRHANKAWT